MTTRLLHIIPSLDRAGAEKQLTLLAAGLPRDEFEVHVCALTRGGPLAAELRAAGVPVTVIGKRWKFDPLAYWRLKQFIAHLQPGLVHTWMFAANAYGRAAARAAGVKHLIASERCVDRWKSNYQFAIDRRLAPHTEKIVVNAPAVRDFCVAHGLPAEKFVVIPNGIAPARPSRLSRDQLLAELELPPETRLIGAVGRLWPQKRVKEIIWGFTLLEVLHPSARLLIVGDGPQRAILESFVRDLEVGARVRFLGHRDDVPDLLPHLEMLWLASAYEGLPNAIMEAMAAGVPVVATDIPGNRDLVVPNETGYLVPLNERGPWGVAGDKIFTDPALAQRLGAAAQRRIAEEFSIAALIERQVALYRAVLAGEPCARSSAVSR